MSEMQRLRDRVEELEGLLGMRASFPRPWGLTRRESAILGLLLSRQVCFTECIFASVWGNDSEVENARRIIFVYTHRLRRKLAPLGIELSNNRPGYFLTSEMKRTIRDLVSAHETRCAA